MTLFPASGSGGGNVKNYVVDITNEAITQPFGNVYINPTPIAFTGVSVDLSKQAVQVEFIGTSGGAWAFAFVVNGELQAYLTRGTSSTVSGKLYATICDL